MSEQSPQHLLENLLSQINQNPAHEQLGGLIEQLRHATGLNQVDFAKLVGVHANTILRWENGGRPSFSKIAKLREVLSDNAEKSEDTDFCYLGDECRVDHTAVSIHSRAYLLDQEQHARKFWILRSNTQFYSGIGGGIRDYMIRLLEETDIEYRFLFPKTSNHELRGFDAVLGMSTAERSHESFLRVIVERDKVTGKNIRQKVRGWPVERDDCLALGIGCLTQSSVFVQYRSEYVAQHQREFDIFVEIPVAVLNEARTVIQGEREQMCWLRIATGQAERIRDIWQPIFEKYEGVFNMSQGGYLDGIPHHKLDSEK